MHFDAFKVLKKHLVATDFQHFWGGGYTNNSPSQIKSLQFVYFTSPSPIFPGSILLPPVNGVDAPACSAVGHHTGDVGLLLNVESCEVSWHRRHRSC